MLVVGTGYVGLVTGVCLAHYGHEVLCVDQDAKKIAALQRGSCPIHEAGLVDLLQEQLAAGQLRFAAAVPDPCAVDIALIAVGTPPTPDGAADLCNVFLVVDELARKLRAGALLGTKSTVPVGTALRMDARLRELGRSDVKVVSVPEFLREGTAVADTLAPHRLVFGVADEAALQVLQELHRNATAPVLACDRSTAEMIKYASNAFLATKISFINEIANICERVHADVQQVAQGMGLDPRIGPSFLRAGLGYGGSCFPKDTRALVNIAGDVDYDFELLRAVVTVNQRQRLEPIYRLRQWLGSLRGKRIALLGVAFKPGTDDIRESPALDLAEVLVEAGADVQLSDPVVTHFVTERGMVRVEADAYAALAGADAAVLVTEWPEFVQLDWQRVRQVMRQPYLFDGRNVTDLAHLQHLGFVCGNIGRQSELLVAGA